MEKIDINTCTKEELSVFFASLELRFALSCAVEYPQYFDDLKRQYKPVINVPNVAAKKDTLYNKVKRFIFS